MENNDSAKAIIKEDCITIQIPIENLQMVLDIGHEINVYQFENKFKIIDPKGFAKDICYSLNDEDEEGTTMIHKMFDKAIENAIEQGSFHIEEITNANR